MSRIRIRGGTPNHTEPSLCRTCRCAQIVTGRRIDENLVLCYNRGSDAIPMRMHVTRCSDYEDKSTPALWELQKIAWRISADKKTAVGFGAGKVEILNPEAYRERYPNDD